MKGSGNETVLYIVMYEEGSGNETTIVMYRGSGIIVMYEGGLGMRHHTCTCRSEYMYVDRVQVGMKLLYMYRVVCRSQKYLNDTYIQAVIILNTKKMVWE